MCGAEAGVPCRDRFVHTGRRFDIGLCWPGMHLGDRAPLLLDGRCRATVETTYAWDFTRQGRHDIATREAIVSRVHAPGARSNRVAGCMHRLRMGWHARTPQRVEPSDRRRVGSRSRWLATCPRRGALPTRRVIEADRSVARADRRTVRRPRPGRLSGSLARWGDPHPSPPLRDPFTLLDGVLQHLRRDHRRPRHRAAFDAHRTVGAVLTLVADQPRGATSTQPSPHSSRWQAVIRTRREQVVPVALRVARAPQSSAAVLGCCPVLTVVALDLIFQVAYPTRLAFDVFAVCTSHCIEAPTRSVELRGEDSPALRASTSSTHPATL